MFIMGKLSCVGDGSSTQRGKERKRRRYAYYFKNREICRGSFLFVYGVGSKYVKNIVSHLNENGFVPRIHKNKNRRPGNAFNFEDLKNAVNFIQNYADEFGLPQPNVKNHGNPSVFLPSAGNKTLLHSTYVTSCRETENRHVGLTTFKLLWKDCCPHIKYTFRHLSKVRELTGQHLYSSRITRETLEYGPFVFGGKGTSGKHLD